MRRKEGKVGQSIAPWRQIVLCEPTYKRVLLKFSRSSEQLFLNLHYGTLPMCNGHDLNNHHESCGYRIRLYIEGNIKDEGGLHHIANETMGPKPRVSEQKHKVSQVFSML